MRRQEDLAVLGKAKAMVFGKSDCLMVPVKRVMIVEGSGQRNGVSVNEEAGTAHRGG